MDEVVDAVARAICARDYVNGPPLWEDVSIERRWDERSPEEQQHYVWLAGGAVAKLEEMGLLVLVKVAV